MVKNGKKYREVAALVNNETAYQPEEAVDLVKKTARAKFDETVELHLRMGLDPRNAAQQVRGIALLPHGLGKKVRVLVFAQGEAERVATWKKAKSRCFSPYSARKRRWSLTFYR